MKGFEQLVLSVKEWINFCSPELYPAQAIFSCCNTSEFLDASCFSSKILSHLINIVHAKTMVAMSLKNFLN